MSNIVCAWRTGSTTGETYSINSPEKKLGYLLGVGALLARPCTANLRRSLQADYIALTSCLHASQGVTVVCMLHFSRVRWKADSFVKGKPGPAKVRHVALSWAQDQRSMTVGIVTMSTPGRYDSQPLSFLFPLRLLQIFRRLYLDYEWARFAPGYIDHIGRTGCVR